MRMQIYYFSGTGNSLFIATQLGRLFPEAEIVSILHALRSGLDAIQADPDWSFWKGGLLFPALTAILHKTKYLHTDEKFYADESCTGCSLCSKVCLSGKIELKHGKPSWKEETDCLFCFACINYCPREAIQIRKSKSASKGRFHQPSITVHMIAQQKH